LNATRPSGPAWLGIGAQRSGTTWLTDLLCQHPGMDVGVTEKKGTVRRVKEHQYLPKAAEGRVPVEPYQERFDAEPGVALGEWSPSYLSTLSVPHLAARVCRPGAPFFVVLRDPVARYESAMRLRVQRSRSRWPVHLSLATAQWNGCYADQLDAWAAVVGRERLVVMTFEAARDDPATACNTMWSKVGLEPVGLRKVDKPSKSSSRSSTTWEWPEGLQEQLIRLYTPQVRRLRDDWGLDVSPWHNFEGTS
jgi:hypothetical protein